MLLTFLMMKSPDSNATNLMSCAVLVSTLPFTG